MKALGRSQTRFTQHLSITGQRRIERDFLIEEDSRQTIARTLNPVAAAAAKSLQLCPTYLAFKQAQGLPWWSSGYDSVLSIQGAAWV